MGLLGGIVGASLGILVVVAVSASRTWTPCWIPGCPWPHRWPGRLIGLALGHVPLVESGRHGTGRGAASGDLVIVRKENRMTHVRHRVAPSLAAADRRGPLRGCGGDDPAAPNTPVELEDQLGFSESGVAERQSRVEGRIRDCMKAQGFDYVPVDPLAQRAALTGNARMSDEEFLDQFGYGISTLFGRGGTAVRPQPAAAQEPRAGRQVGVRPRPLGRQSRPHLCGGHRQRRRHRARRLHQDGDGSRRSAEPRCSRAFRVSSTSSRSGSHRTSEWSERWSSGPRCMEERGYRYAEPEEIDTDLLKRFHVIVGPEHAGGCDCPRRARRHVRSHPARRAETRRGEGRACGSSLREARDHTGRAGGATTVRGCLPRPKSQADQPGAPRRPVSRGT